MSGRSKRPEAVALREAFKALDGAESDVRDAQTALRNAEYNRNHAQKLAGRAIGVLRVVMGATARNAASVALRGYTGPESIANYIEIEDGVRWSDDEARRVATKLLEEADAEEES